MTRATVDIAAPLGISVQIILDRSEGMKRRIADNTTKLDLARKAVSGSCAMNSSAPIWRSALSAAPATAQTRRRRLPSARRTRGEYARNSRPRASKPRAAPLSSRRSSMQSPTSATRHASEESTSTSSLPPEPWTAATGRSWRLPKRSTIWQATAKANRKCRYFIGISLDSDAKSALGASNTRAERLTSSTISNKWRMSSRSRRSCA
jgi:hypothetical protein